jgi:hypothetical protein
MSETDETTTEEQGSPSPSPTRKASRRKVAPRNQAQVDRESSESSDEAPAVEEQAVRIVNQLGQLLEVSVLTEDGQQIGVRLGPHERTDPILPSRITDYTQRLIGRGYLSVTNS